LFDADVREFKRRRDYYNAVLAALGQPSARPSQKLRLPGKGKIVVTFSVEDLAAKAADGSKWDVLLVGWEMEQEHDVLRSLRESARCCITALAHQHFQPRGIAQPSSVSRQIARYRGFFDFCENNEMVYTHMQSCCRISESLQSQRLLIFFSVRHLISHQCNPTRTQLFRYLFCCFSPGSRRYHVRTSAGFRFRSMP
jgi:hypothetical protein